MMYAKSIQNHVIFMNAPLDVQPLLELDNYRIQYPLVNFHYLQTMY